MQHELEAFIRNALTEDIGGGDYSSLACIPVEATRRARLLVKEDGILAGVNLALEVFRIHDTRLKTTLYMADGAVMRKGDVAFEVQFNQLSTHFNSKYLVSRYKDSNVSIDEVKEIGLFKRLLRSLRF